MFKLGGGAEASSWCMGEALSSWLVPIRMHCGSRFSCQTLRVSGLKSLFSMMHERGFKS